MKKRIIYCIFVEFHRHIIFISCLNLHLKKWQRGWKIAINIRLRQLLISTIDFHTMNFDSFHNFRGMQTRVLGIKPPSQGLTDLIYIIYHIYNYIQVYIIYWNHVSYFNQILVDTFLNYWKVWFFILNNYIGNILFKTLNMHMSNIFSAMNPLNIILIIIYIITNIIILFREFNVVIITNL